MANFIELTRVDNTPLLLNKYHISTVSQSVQYPNRITIRMNNGSVQDVIDSYEDVKDILAGKTDVCK